MDKSSSNIVNSLLSLQEVFRVIGDQLNARDVRVLKFMFSGIFTPEFLNQINDGFSFLQALEKIDRIDESNFKTLENYLKIICRHDLFQYLTLRRRKIVKKDKVNEYLEQSTSRKSSSQTKCPHKCDSCDRAFSKSTAISSDTPSTSDNQSQEPKHTSKDDKESSELSSDTKRPVNLDECSPGPSSKRSCLSDSKGNPKMSKSGTLCATPPSSLCQNGATRTRRSLDNKTPARRSERLKRRSMISVSEPTELSDISYSVEGMNRAADDTLPASPLGSAAVTDTKGDQINKKITCDIRLRVRAEYCSHESALQGNVHSNKAELIERQFEKFMQANTILRSRDLGSIICDIKFSELTYLDAFWRDYINGSLLEALKGVFITEPLKQAVGHEAIKLVVNVDEDDYEKGRLVLLKNLQQTRS